MVHASFSSVCGSYKKVPYSTDDKDDNPVSLYGATQKSNELMAHAYFKLYNIPSITVYGPVGRPDMAHIIVLHDKLRAGKTIQIFNYGNCKRDYTYIDDIIGGCSSCNVSCSGMSEWRGRTSILSYMVYNIGNNQPENFLIL